MREGLIEADKESFEALAREVDTIRSIGNDADAMALADDLAELGRFSGIPSGMAEKR